MRLARVEGTASPAKGIPCQVEDAAHWIDALRDGREAKRETRVREFRDLTSIGDYSGVFTHTAWQDVDMRDAVLCDLTRIGTAPEKVTVVLSRVGRAGPGDGSGLGLAAVEAFAGPLANR